MVRSRKRSLPCSVAHTVLCGSLVLLVVPEVVLLGLPLKLDCQRWLSPTRQSELVQPPRREVGVGVGDSQHWLYPTRQSDLLVQTPPRQVVCVGDGRHRLYPRPSELVLPPPREVLTGDGDSVTDSVGDTLGDSVGVGDTISDCVGVGDTISECCVVGVGDTISDCVRVGVGDTTIGDGDNSVTDSSVGDSVVRRRTSSFAVGAAGDSSSSSSVGRVGRRRTSFTAGAAVVSNNEPFVDDGMFDPRRDYWGDRSKGSTSSASATQNWASGGRATYSVGMRCMCVHGDVAPQVGVLLL